MDRKERFILKNKAAFKKRYGADWERVLYATANKQFKEEHGAGEWGTNKLTDKYKNDTPGQEDAKVRTKKVILKKRIDEATPPSGPKNPDKPHVGKTAHEKKVERYQQYLAKKKRDREQHLRNNPGLKQGGERRRIQPNAFYSKRAFRNQEINASFDPDVEQVEEARGSDYKLYHKSYTDAVKHAFAHHAKSGLRSSDDDKMHHIGLNSKKPGEGKTTSVKVPATHKSGKKHQIHIQVYNKGGSNPYELNTYSSTHRSMQEAKGDSTSTTIKVSGGDAVEIGKVKRGGRVQYYWKAKSGLKNVFDSPEKLRYSLRNTANFSGAEKAVAKLQQVNEAKSEYSKLMKQYGDMPMSKVPMKTRMRIRELGRKVRGDKPVSGLRASDLVDDMKRRQMGEAKSDRLEKIARAAAAREKDQAKQKEAAKQKHYAASAKSREAVKHFGNKDQFGRVREDIEQVDEAGMIGRTKPSRELNVQKFEKKYLGTKSLKDTKRAAHKAERKKGKQDVKINPSMDENVDAAKERVDQAKQRVMVAKQRLARTKARDYGNKVRGMRSEEISAAKPRPNVVRTTQGNFQQKTLQKHAERRASKAGQTQSRTTELAKRIRRRMRRRLRRPRPTMNR